MTNTLRSLIVSLTVPLFGGLLALPGVAQTPAPEQPLAPTALAPLPTPLYHLDRDPQPVKLPASELRKWPPPNEQIDELTDTQTVELVLQLDQRQLHVYRGDTLEKTFPVAVGKTGWETPTGSFEVSYMLENPGWTNPFTGDLMPPGPNNPLGERWIAFWTDGRNEIGFHGTPNRDSIGQAASHGCVRLYNEHIRELYELVTPGTLVTVLQ
ncbi:L,D-transpeptidase [Leptolyngbyaceae cyanobacterium CCMR0082]|uniref:L,D-transpeptidase n=2 Tax=Adonisia turfae TaxID=2950184 RepID=A0A6M0S4Q1_9CYAN|nr:L,D-transpeptidase [Leptothoe sp. LEGE 181152]NEZ55158.1 L,D-transpeptidase [Adonisia turfae CCMR0081]NEZ63043.1 L,D-transpeptidase [Adonisia turfae CCMR0082]